MGKQAMGIFARNYARRLDKNGYILCSPMRPFVETQIMKTLLTHEMPSGDNIIVAIGCYGGYNQEDSVILNKASINRGLFRTLYYTMYKDEEHRNIASGKEEKFTKPRRENTRGFKASYHGVNEHGVPIMNATIKENDVVIGKVTSIKSDPNGYQYRDSSMTHKNAEECRIDGVWNDRNSDGYPFVKVRVVSERIPEIGDKFSSRHGQKGTCGIMLNEEDMPFSASGLRTDLIMNPHAVPSRMTIAQLMETMYGKVCCNKGTLGDGTPYSHLPVENIREQLLSLGMHPYGNEILYNGQTGEMMEAEIFMGPTFYQRLKHMVKDKTQSRARGPIVSLTRQPCEGRSRDGGLRVGEMERDCLISHGVSKFLNESLMDRSDKSEVLFQPETGYLDSSADLQGTTLETPYSLGIIIRELESMHILVKLAAP
jgi:DNA-directed RNA polymerase II subunit RPB2